MEISNKRHKLLRVDYFNIVTIFRYIGIFLYYFMKMLTSQSIIPLLKSFNSWKATHISTSWTIHGVNILSKSVLVSPTGMHCSIETIVYNFTDISPLGSLSSEIWLVGLHQGPAIWIFSTSQHLRQDWASWNVLSDIFVNISHSKMHIWYGQHLGFLNQKCSAVKMQSIFS